MSKKMVHLIFPQKLIKKPVIYTMSKKFNLIPNIRRAKVTETIGEMSLEIEGQKDELEKGLKYIAGLGVTVEPIVGDIIE